MNILHFFICMRMRGCRQIKREKRTKSATSVYMVEDMSLILSGGGVRRP